MKALKQNVILFDLDGTLTDSAAGVVTSIHYSLESFGYKFAEETDWNFLIGPPMMDSLLGYFQLNEKDAIKVFKTYRRHYEAEGMYETKIYPGVKEMLAELMSKGKRLGVATSKNQDFAIKILKHFGLLNYFEFIAGSNFENPNERNTKAKVLEYALENLQANTTDTVLVGDRMYDIVGAKEIGIPVVAVEYGYGTKTELVGYGADYIVKTPADVSALFD